MSKGLLRGAKIQTHDLLTHVVLLQPVHFITVVWPLSDLTSWPLLAAGTLGDLASTIATCMVTSKPSESLYI